MSQSPQEIPVQTEVNATEAQIQSAVASNLTIEDPGIDKEVPSEKGSSEPNLQASKIHSRQTSQNISLEETVKNFLKQNNIACTESELSELIQFVRAKNQMISIDLYQEWNRGNREKEQGPQQNLNSQVQEESSQPPLVEKEQAGESNLVQAQKPGEVKKELTTSEFLNQWLENYSTQNPKEIKSKIVSAANEIMLSKLHISTQTIQTYLANGEPTHSLSLFQEWLIKHQQQTVITWGKQLSESENGKQLLKNIGKIEDLLNLATRDGSTLKIGFGLGESRGKTSFRFGVELQDAPKQKFEITIDVKIKKKSQLKSYLDNYLRKAYSAPENNTFKIFKYSTEQTEKSVRVTLGSVILEEYILKDLITKLEDRCSTEEKLLLKLDGEVAIKNSIRSQQNRLQSKKFVKWLAEGMTVSVRIEGNSRVVQHFTSPLSQFFPIFTVVKSGEVNLKLKNSENVEKLFDKLGINELSQVSPSLGELSQHLIGEYLSERVWLCVGDLLKNILLFECKTPNEKILCELNLHISHLKVFLALSADACKQLGEMLVKAGKVSSP